MRYRMSHDASTPHPHASHPHPEHRGTAEALARIEGQVRGVARMIDEGRYCMDVLQQTRAIHAALRRVERQILDGHLRHCVNDAFRSDDPARRDQSVAEILGLFDKERG
jgi:DNA-binding FrmR family transcriptional regulator